jgi:hypothetical protein
VDDSRNFKTLGHAVLLVNDGVIVGGLAGGYNRSSTVVLSHRSGVARAYVGSVGWV